MEVPTFLDTGSPHPGSTPTSPSFTITPATRQPLLRSLSRPNTPVQNLTLDPPQGISFPDFLRQWNDQHVARWLADNKCVHHAQTFANHDIRGDILLDLEQQTLRDMGIPSVGDRIKILNGVKALRVKCANAREKSNGSPGTNANVNGNANFSAAAAVPESQRLLPVKMHSDSPVESSLTTRRYNTRPPPLHLSSATTQGLPQLIRNESGGRIPRPLPLPQSNIGHTHSHSTSSTKDSNGVTRGLPPLPPAPRVHPPVPPGHNRNVPTANNNNTGMRSGLLPPHQSQSGRRTPTPAEPPPSFTKDPLPPAPCPATPSSGTLWTKEYGLHRGPSPGNPGGRSATPARSVSPLPLQPRPRTSALASNGAHARSNSNSNGQYHPYATAPNQVPAALQLPANPAVNVLSPIQENFMSQHANSNSNTGSSTPSFPSASPSNSNNSPYRTPYRPATPSGRAQPMSAEDIRRKCVKFILADDGHSRLVNVEDVPRGTEVLEFVLRKFGKSAGIGFPSMDVEQMDYDSIDVGEGLVVDGWGVFLDDNIAESPGGETELLLICHDDQNPARELGLTLRRVTKPPKRSKVLANYFGETPPRVASPSPQDNLLAQLNAPDTRTVKQMNRASSVSILSGLGVPDPERALAPPVPSDSPPKPASPTPSFRAKTQSKLRNFLGHRPPSELIATHLQEYFPFTEKKVLERTQRQSMIWVDPSSFSSPPLPPVPLLTDSQSVRSGRSMQSGRSGISIITSRSDEAPPRMSVETSDGGSIDPTDDPALEPWAPTPPLLLPPVQFPTETETLSETMNKVGRGLARTNSNASRRTSYLLELRNKRDRSDTASMLTVDEITQEVENRRASMVQEGEQLENEELTVGASETLVSDGETMRKGEGEDEEDADMTVNEEEGEEEHKADASSEGKRFIKWIKGALIGAGSFGSVYLGMDAFHGLLMAVKQVELPTGSAPNEERKKSMLSALEREIELLKELQHDNIVQYLDSSNDGVYLNIFLEYVPGGSVATLLKNYGAFEEALVRNFVRQILQGLDYLHERDIIHRDIKGGNILVDNKGGIKISDFGISKKVEDSILTGARLHRPSLQGSVFWMAPEVVKQTSYTLKADIWSVGCLVVEMLTGEHPWAQLTQMQAIFKIGSSARPAFPSDISADAEDFLNKTFELDHNLRPSAAQLLLHPWIVKDPANPNGISKSNKASKAVPEVSVSP
ncbi:Pkinase-domain-containing protein [Hysterangium stoloniferum]|nr:Pkinase-domain-containing protein [Hysterangium stoloniferum]